MRNLTTNNSPDSITSVRHQIITHSPYSPSKKMTMIVAREGAKQFSKVTVFTKIKAPVEVCFDLVAKQLEEVPRWDPIIKWVVPISHDYTQVGSKSQVTFDLAGSIEEAEVVLQSFVPNRVIIWTSDHSTRLQEEWRFEREPDYGTHVMVTLSYNPYRGWLKYFSKWTRVSSQIELAASEMLGRLKRVAEIHEQKFSKV